MPQQLTRGQALVGDLAAVNGIIEVSMRWDANIADTSFFVANRKYKIKKITARVDVLGTDAGAVTGAIKKAATGTAIASGTALHTGTINLKGTISANQVLTLSTTDTDLDIATGNAIGFDLTGTPTAAVGSVSILLAPRF